MKTLDEILEQYKEDIASTLSQAIDEELDREACEDRITALKHFYKQEILDWHINEVKKLIRRSKPVVFEHIDGIQNVPYVATINLMAEVKKLQKFGEIK